MYIVVVMVGIIACLAFLATYLGGLFALKLKDRLHLVLGFSAGAVMAVAFFDLIPESIKLGSANFSIETILSFSALGFVVYLLIDRFFFPHVHSEHDEELVEKNGVLGAGSLSVHSFLDGLGIGLAFQAGMEVGLIVAVAVLAHDFSDGINTVNMIIRQGGSERTARKWLIVDSVAPVIGVLSTMFFTLPGNILSLILALFAGFFIYISATDLIPESFHAHPTWWTTFMTILGFAALFLIVRLAGI